jgi:hypothetical protein
MQSGRSKLSFPSAATFPSYERVSPIYLLLIGTSFGEMHFYELKAQNSEYMTKFQVNSDDSARKVRLLATSIELPVLSLPNVQVEQRSLPATPVWCPDTATERRLFR